MYRQQRLWGLPLAEERTLPERPRRLKGTLLRCQDPLLSESIVHMRSFLLEGSTPCASGISVKQLTPNQPAATKQRERKALHRHSEEGETSVADTYFVVVFFCPKSIWLGKLRNPGQFLGATKSFFSSVVFVDLVHLQPEGAVKGRTLTHTPLVTLLPSK